MAARCDGNPFFAEESARLLGDRAQGCARPGLGAGGDRSPPGCASGREHKAACIADAAVVGEVFWDGALTELGQRVRGDVAAALDALEEQAFRAPRTRPPRCTGESEFVFAHALARDVAYGAIPRRSRAEKHAQAAALARGQAG